MAKKRSSRGKRVVSKTAGSTPATKTGNVVTEGINSPNDSHSTAMVTVGQSNPSSSGTTKETNAIPDNRCYLLEMTAEIRQKIWALAVQHDDPISPKQVKHRSNKFWPTRQKIAATSTKPTKDDHTSNTRVTAVQLSLTCHQLYDEIASTGLFYQLNKINFPSFDDMLAYLVAITPVRRNAIRSVSIEYNHDRWSMKHAITMLSTCKGLRSLEVNILFQTRWIYGYWGHGLFDEITSKISGLEEFKFVPLDDPYLKREAESAALMGITRSEESIRKEEAEVVARGRDIEAAVTGARRDLPVSKIRAAEEASRLNIFGEGRLGPDKKPGIISSRTRGQLQKEKNLDEFGVLQEVKEQPKFSKFGDLLWDIWAIDGSRELASDHGKKRIEVHVIWANKKHEASWEILDRIINAANVLQVGRHYVKNPEAYDIGIAMSTIKEFVEKDTVQALVLESLTTMMKKNDGPEAVAKARRLLRSKTFR